MSREHSTMGKETLPLPHLEGLGCAASQPCNTGKSGKISQGNQSWKAGGRGGAGVQLPASISQHPRAGQGWRQLTLPKLGMDREVSMALQTPESPTWPQMAPQSLIWPHRAPHGPTDPTEPHMAPQSPMGTRHKAGKLGTRLQAVTRNLPHPCQAPRSCRAEKRIALGSPNPRAHPGNGGKYCVNP